MRARRMVLEHAPLYALVDHLVDNTLRELEERNRARGTPSRDPIGLFRRLTTGVIAVECWDGAVRKVFAQIDTAEGTKGLGNFVARAYFIPQPSGTAGHGTVAGTIGIDLREDRSLLQMKQYKHELHAELLRTLSHELTHAQDRPPTRLVDPTVDRRPGTHARYVNQPHEVRAVAREIAVEARPIFLVGRRRKQWASLTGRALLSVLEQTPTWTRIARHLTRANAAAIAKYVARELED